MVAEWVVGYREGEHLAFLVLSLPWRWRWGVVAWPVWRYRADAVFYWHREAFFWSDYNNYQSHYKMRLFIKDADGSLL
jgi:hypothetical protein